MTWIDAEKLQIFFFSDEENKYRFSNLIYILKSVKNAKEKFKLPN